jgi:thiol-disulfide isomerase/thioredoxin
LEDVEGHGKNLSFGWFWKQKDAYSHAHCPSRKPQLQTDHTFKGMRFLLALVLSLAAITPLPACASKTVNFAFTDTAGKTLHLSDFQGKWVLVNFWAPWCGLCLTEIPLLNALSQRADMVVIGIALDYGPDETTVQDSANAHNMDVTAVVAGGSRRDPNSPYHQVGEVDFYPTTYLYDPAGEIVMRTPGPLRLDKLYAFMERWDRKRPATGG